MLRKRRNVTDAAMSSGRSSTSRSAAAANAVVMAFTTSRPGVWGLEWDHFATGSYFGEDGDPTVPALVRPSLSERAESARAQDEVSRSGAYGPTHCPDRP